jgi:predicted RNA-binding Zn-ribbon protein involved in translation (DUF1610 family)
MTTEDTQLDLFEKKVQKTKKIPFPEYKYQSLEEKAQEGYFKWQDYYKLQYQQQSDEYYQPYRKNYNTCHCGLPIEITYNPVMRELASAFDPTVDMTQPIAVPDIIDKYHCPNCGNLWYMRDVKILRVEGKYRELRGKGLNGST